MAYDDASLKYDRWTQGQPRTFTNPQSSSNNQWFGTTLVVSQQTAVANTLVNSTSRIFYSLEWLGVCSYATAPHVEVASKVAGVGWYFAVVNSIGLSAAGCASIQVHWEMTTPTP